MAPTKATKAATQIKKGAGAKDVKVRSKVHFYKPQTQKLERQPKYPRKSMPSLPSMDKHRVIKYPLTTEVRACGCVRECLVCVRNASIGERRWRSPRVGEDAGGLLSCNPHARRARAGGT